MKKYAIHPGWIISRNDGDRHFITFRQLCDLYDVDPKECFPWSDGAGLTESKYIHLYPRKDGNYARKTYLT